MVVVYTSSKVDIFVFADCIFEKSQTVAIYKLGFKHQNRNFLQRHSFCSLRTHEVILHIAMFTALPHIKSLNQQHHSSKFFRIILFPRRFVCQSM